MTIKIKNKYTKHYKRVSYMKSQHLTLRPLHLRVQKSQHHTKPSTVKGASATDRPSSRERSERPFYPSLSIP